MSSQRYGITAKLLVAPQRLVHRPLVVVEDGRVASASSRDEQETPSNLRVLDFPDCVLTPGFVDIHIHGGAGRDVMESGEDALCRIEEHLIKTGVTSYLPTTVTAPVDITLQALEKLGKAVRGSAGSDSELRAQPLGIHLEGPFISPAKCGVHPKEHIQPPSLELFERMWQASAGRIRMVTLAPERPGAVDLIGAIASRGVCVSLGHSDSDLPPVKAAIAAGARHATHTFNAMRPLDHREPGILGAVLSSPALTADIIADGIHVHPEILRLFLRAKGSEATVLITDAISATGMGDGRYRLGTFEVEVQGQRCLCHGRLAGSVLTMDRAISNVMQFAGSPLEHAIQSATLNPARVGGVATRSESGTLVPWKGTVEPGADADMVVLAGAVLSGGAVQIVKTIQRGRGI